MYWGMKFSVAEFSLRRAGTTIKNNTMFNSGSTYSSGNSHIRPVIHLGSNIKITRSETASNAGTPHRITQY